MKKEAVDDGDFEMNVKQTYSIDRSIVLDQEGLSLKGGSCYKSGLVLSEGATDDCVVDVVSRLCSIENLYINSNYKKGIYLRKAQLFMGRNIITKGNDIGILHEEGNSATISGYFAETNNYGYVAEAVGEGNVNGCFIQGRAINCHVGWDIRDNKAPTGPGNAFMHNFLRITAEANSIGIRERTIRNKSRYNYGFLYSEGNNKPVEGFVNRNYDISDDNPNWYAISNPDNETLMSGGKLIGVYSSGEQISNVQNDLNKQKFVNLNENSTLDGDGVETYYISNTSGVTKGVYLQYLQYAQVGTKRTIYKYDDTPGFLLNAPEGITLVGDVNLTYGAYCQSQVSQIDIRKISDGLVLVQYFRKES
ncbi:hypothetical protein ACTTBA_04015 [Shewanella frigidimarina]|uniref:hypothetical protein n=1 Tax=Shewanella frigidimarina TaxID=56812 RepID=UPI003F9EF8FD